MMPGVVAGFALLAAAGPPTGPITLTAGSNTDPYTGDRLYGFNSAEQIGSISPAFGSVIPNAPAINGASGELLGMDCLFDSFNGGWSLSFWCVGLFPVAPFAAVVLDSRTIPAADFSVWVDEEYGVTSFNLRSASNLQSNPLQVGQHIVEFI